MAQKPNLTVGVTVMCKISQDGEGNWKASATYSGISVPPALPGQKVVSEDGTINLKAIDRKNPVFKSIYSNDSNIFFYLGVEWPHNSCFAMNASNPADASRAITVSDKDADKQKYAATMMDPWILMLVDVDQSGDTANYQLNVAIDLDGNGDVIVLPIDPIVINRGVGD